MLRLLSLGSSARVCQFFVKATNDSEVTLWIVGNMYARSSKSKAMSRNRTHFRVDCRCETWWNGWPPPFAVVWSWRYLRDDEAGNTVARNRRSKVFIEDNIFVMISSVRSCLRVGKLAVSKSIAFSQLSSLSPWSERNRKPMNDPRLWRRFHLNYRSVLGVIFSSRKSVNDLTCAGLNASIKAGGTEFLRNDHISKLKCRGVRCSMMAFRLALRS